MKKYQIVMMLIGCLSFFIGCSSNKQLYQRGWIGGAYIEANPSFFKKVSSNYFEKSYGVIPSLPDKIKKQQKGAILVSKVYEKTPVMKADIKEGDLILKINDEPIENIKEFRKLVDKSTPGAEIILTIYRGGEIMTMPIIVGKETYEKWHSFSLGFRLGTELDPVPHPEFDILHILSYQTNNNRLELNSPEYIYYTDTQSDLPDQEEIAKKDDVSWEGWDVWCVIFGFSGKKIILDQEFGTL